MCIRDSAKARRKLLEDRAASHPKWSEAACNPMGETTQRAHTSTASNVQSYDWRRAEVRARAGEPKDPGVTVIRWGRPGGSGIAVRELADEGTTRTFQGAYEDLEACAVRQPPPFHCTPDDKDMAMEAYERSMDKLDGGVGDAILRKTVAQPGRLKHLRQSTSWYEDGRNGRR